jgi:leader peptidase (prepilin peptidase)/N-methyltransferase
LSSFISYFDTVFSTLLSVPWFFYTVIFFVSLMVGSFLNVVIYRLPIMMERSWVNEFLGYFNVKTEAFVTLLSDKNQVEQISKHANQPTFNLATPNSTCPHCGHRIRAWENIPMLSYLMLGGKCSHCKTAISMRYPIVELLTALFSVWIALHFGPSTTALLAVVFTWFLIAMTGIDVDTMLLPDQLTLPLLWLGLVASLGEVFVGPVDAILGAIFGYLSLWSVYWLFKLLTGKEGMGYGDFKLLAALGAFTGWQGLAMIILLSSVVGAVVGISIMLVKKKDTNLAIPFGPYLAAAGWLTLMYGDAISDYYFTQILGL